MWEIRALGAPIPRGQSKAGAQAEGGTLPISWRSSLTSPPQASLYLKGPGLNRKALPPGPALLSWRPRKDEDKTKRHPQSQGRPHPKGHQKPEGLPHRGQCGPVCVPLTVFSFLIQKEFPATHIPAARLPWGLAQPPDFVPPPPPPHQEVGAAAETWVQFLPCPTGPWHLGQEAGRIKGTE